MKHGHTGLIILIFVVFLAIIGKLFFLDISHIQGHSMEPLLHKDQIVFVNAMAYGLLWPINKIYLFHWARPKPGEVVVVRDPRENKVLIKRCVAVEGDPWNIEGGYLVARGCYYPLTQYSYLLQETSRLVPLNHILVVGDNYEDSIDSRTFGYIEWNDILGRVIGVNTKLCPQQIR